MQAKERAVTISSIYSNQPGTIGSLNETYPAEMREGVTAKQETHETLREVTDQAKLSSLAPRIQAVFSEFGGFGNSVFETLSVNVEKLQDGFVETLYSVLSKENIDVTQKMTLRLDGNEILTVAGEHPEKDKIDAMLAEQPALSTAFGEIASQSEVLRDIANINKVMSRYTGMEAYAASGLKKPDCSVYQMSLKGDMSHFYFSRV